MLKQASLHPLQLATKVVEHRHSSSGWLAGALLTQSEESGDSISESQVCSRDLLPDPNVQCYFLALVRIMNRI